MRVFGLIGYPLSHSFSKKYFTLNPDKATMPNITTIPALQYALTAGKIL